MLDPDPLQEQIPALNHGTTAPAPGNKGFGQSSCGGLLEL